MGGTRTNQRQRLTFIYVTTVIKRGDKTKPKDMYVLVIHLNMNREKKQKDKMNNIFGWSEYFITSILISATNNYVICEFTMT